MRRLLIPALALALLALFLGHLADPQALLATRDVPIFHLPLRTALADAVAQGAPSWNPSIHGGQPILSNPNYAAFYPPTWLLLLVPPHYSISLIILLHAAIGFAGAWRFARHLGCDDGPALLAGIGFSFGGAPLAATSLLTTYCGLAWMPWILYGCDRRFRADTSSPRMRHTALPVAAFGAQILAGEPVIVLTTGLAACCLAIAAKGQRLRSIGHLAAISVLATLLASVQLLPTLDRLRDSPRAEGIDPEVTLEWSAHPRRAIELLWPRAWGDPMRIDENLYFGWSIHDRQFPYLYSLYPGQLVVLIAFAALARWPIKRRVAWAAMIAAGMFLATGAYNPAMAWLSRVAPGASAVRFPEKLLLMVTVALVFAAALGWQRLLEARKENQTPLEDFPLALAVTLAGINTLLLVVLTNRPDVGEWFARTNSVLPLTVETQQLAASFLRAESITALVLSLASVLIFALHRWRTVPRPPLVVLTLGVLLADLWVYNHTLTPTIPAAELMRPPAPIAAFAATGERLFTDRAFLGSEPLTLKSDRPGPDTLWTQIDRADPYLATLWGLQYAIHEDFDLMATSPTRQAMRALRVSWGDDERVQRILGAWSVRYLLTNRSLPDILQQRLRDRQAHQVAVLENPLHERRVRFENEVVFHADLDEAMAADRLSGFRETHWVGAPEPGQWQSRPSSGAPELLWERHEPSLVEIHYRSPAEVPMTVAVTWDRGWRAAVDGSPIPIFRTSLGMMGVLLPEGDHLLQLRFRAGLVLPGLAISLLTLTGLAAGAASRRRGLERPG